jgi:hypothetical protein
VDRDSLMLCLLPINEDGGYAAAVPSASLALALALQTSNGVLAVAPPNGELLEIR